MKKILRIIFIAFAAVICLTGCNDSGSQTGTIREPSYVSLSSKVMTFEDVGLSQTLEYEIGPESLSSKEVEWSSSNEKVAVCEDGVITSVGYGVCNVKITIKATGEKASCVVTVKDPSPSIELSSHELLFSGLGQTAVLTATTSEGVNVSTNLSWIVSNRNIVTCQNGVIRTVGFGICSVQVFWRDGTYDFCTVRVEAPNAPQLDLSQNSVHLENIGDEAVIEPIPFPDVSSKVSWMSSDPTVATVENGVIKAVGEGNCAIIAICENGRNSACGVVVGKATEYTPPPDTISYRIDDMHKVLNYVDRQTGQVVTSVMITSYEAMFQRSEDNIIITCKLHCVKTYDAGGEDAMRPVFITANICEADGTLHASSSYTGTGHKVGETFSIELKQFGIAIYPCMVRDIYIDLPQITEQ